MRIFWLVSFICVGFFSTFGQINETIIGSVNHEISWGAVRIQNKLYVSVTETSGYNRNVAGQKLYKLTEDLEKEDSVNLSQIFNSSTIGINHISQISESRFICLTRDKKQSYALVFDTTLTLQDSMSFSFGTDTVIGAGYSTVKNGDTILLGGNMKVDTAKSNSPYFPMLLALIPSSNTTKLVVAYDSLPYRHISSIYQAEDSYLFGIDYENTFFYYLNKKTLEVDSFSHISPTLQPGQFYSPYAFYSKKNDNGFYLAGYEDYFRALSVYSFNRDKNLVRRDTFFISRKQVAVHNDNYTQGTGGNIYFACTVDPEVYESALKPGMFRRLEVHSIDTNGTRNWKKIILDSNYRYVSQITASSDGGVFLFSLLYDPSLYPYLKSQLSIIKLDSLGNIVNLDYKPFSLSRGSIDVFPNPTSDYIEISGIPQDEQMLKYTLYNINGQIVKNGVLDQYNKRIDVSQIPKGTYALQVTNSLKKKFVTSIVVE